MRPTPETLNQTVKLLLHTGAAADVRLLEGPYKGRFFLYLVCFFEVVSLVCQALVPWLKHPEA